MDKKSIYEFSLKWINKFQDKNKNLHEIFETMEFPNECSLLGIEIDGGQSFIKKYGLNNFRNLNTLKKVIDIVDNIQLLGNLIFSKWRWFNHCDYIVYTSEDEEWFIIALTRLAKLTEE